MSPRRANNQGRTKLASGGTGDVPSARRIDTEGPLQGGGDLSANRTLTIDEASESTRGTISASDYLKLQGIEAGADVTDSANVAGAGAVMHVDISAVEGLIRKIGSTTYEAIKTNLTSTTAPGFSDDNTQGYAPLSLWLDTDDDVLYICADAATSLAFWVRIGTYVSSSTPSPIGTTGAAGSGVIPPAWDHIHAHGDLSGGSLHAAATTSAAGFMSAADKTKIDLVRAVIREPGGYPYAVDAGDGVIIVDNSSAPRTINLEAVANMRSKVEILCVASANTYPVTLHRAGSETINGNAADFVIRGANPRAIIVKRGSNYLVHVAGARQRNLFAAANLHSSRYWGSDGYAGLYGNNLMTIVATYKSNAGSPVAQFFWSRFQNTVEGFRFGPATTSGGYKRANLTIYTGVSQAAANVAATGDYGSEWHTMALRMNVGGGSLDVPNNSARLTIDGNNHSSDFSISSFVPATSSGSTNMRLGAANSGDASCEIASLVIVEGSVLSDADLAAYHTQVAGSNRFDLNGAETALWVAEDADATWLDRKGGVSLARVGTPFRVLYEDPVFA